MTRDQLIFSMSFLSNVNANVIESSASDLQNDAEQKISEIVTDLSGYLPDDLEIVWGPFAKSTPLQTKSACYNTDNLMFVAKTSDPDHPGSNMYIVAIAGTNPTSHFGWFSEDFPVSNTIPYVSVNDKKTYGVISQGTATGVAQLMVMPDSSTSGLNQRVANFLTSTVSSTDRIVVTGHSLGGALAPAVAITLKDTFLLNNLNNAFECYPFAGPTPGNAAFANHMYAGMDIYQATNNTLDLVPRSWAVDDLNTIPSLYADNKNIVNCFHTNGIATDVILAGVIAWAVEQSRAKTTYAGPDNYQPSTFTGTDDMNQDTVPYKGKDVPICVALPLIAKETLDVNGPLYQVLNLIWQNQTGKPNEDLGEDELINFYAFLMEGARQHVKGYLDNLLPADVATIFEEVMASSNNPDVADAEEDYNLLQLLNMVFTSIKAKQVVA